MGFSINTNLDALNTYKNLQGVQNSLSKSLEKLSSGLRINNAGDDAAGLTIATQLGSQVSGLTQAARNAQDGVSVVQTADGALTQTQSLLGRLRDLAVQAANDSNSTTARSAIATEATSITDELSRLSTSVNFNGQKLLDGSTNNMKFQIGADGDAASRITVNLSGANLTNIATALNNGTTSTGTSWTTLPAAGDVVDFKSTNANGTATTNSVTFAAAPASFQAFSDQLNANTGFASNFTSTVVKDVNGAATGVLVTAKDAGTVSSTKLGAGTTGAANTGIQFDTADHAQAAITAIDLQLKNVSNARAAIGALENRFASAVSTINTSITNLTAAKSRITDVDMASEMVSYSRANILSQSGTAMLAQANSLPQLALKLLG
ncbi:flagellin [Amnibacterium soli]|uniref:Flagellin n=1 Tax=Amnibacterium soli TaxID=1282736 RepID=A0ABP8Z886_9MICO